MLVVSPHFVATSDHPKLMIGGVSTMIMDVFLVFRTKFWCVVMAIVSSNVCVEVVENV